MSQPALRIVPANTRPRVTWKARPSTLVLGDPQSPTRVQLALAVECVARRAAAWPWALLVLAALGFLAALGRWQ
jgi:hypothetical protein